MKDYFIYKYKQELKDMYVIFKTLNLNISFEKWCDFMYKLNK